MPHHHHPAHSQFLTWMLGTQTPAFAECVLPVWPHLQPLTILAIVRGAATILLLVTSQRSSDNLTLGGTVIRRTEIHRCVYPCASLGQRWESLCPVHVYTCRRHVFTYRNHIISETHQQCLFSSLGISISPRGNFLCLKLN